ncbi:hypothetical protein CMI46_02270 [Candidatus Pacearchaeota archaeon]|nr:hypothetical protein [Candidatus Pacearchaeota archaeon]|tara:strand:+ start:16169 stop:16408 length:240 start_codon:yes stop_codon:yes gene_type:complete
MEGAMRIYYDEEGDYLTIFIGDSKPNYGEEIAEDITLFKDEETNEIIGIGILNFRERAKSLKDIELNLPFKVNFSALSV